MHIRKDQARIPAPNQTHPLCSRHYVGVWKDSAELNGHDPLFLDAFSLVMSGRQAGNKQHGNIAADRRY